MTTETAAPPAAPAEEQEADDIARLLMRHALRGGPLQAVKRLTRLLRILCIVARVITAERNRRAYSLGAQWSQRAAADLVGVSSATMQRWMEAGRPNGSGAPDSAENAHSNGVE